MAANVIETLHSDDAHRCVKVIKYPDGRFGLEEFRKDPEDAGGWTRLTGNVRGSFATEVQAIAAAQQEVAWLRDQRDGAGDAPRAPEAGRSMAKGVVTSLHNDDVDRCVDIIKHADGAFGFKEFRRDPEDGGGWTLVSHNSKAIYATEALAIAAARAGVAWLRREPA
jgi:hypothetical protein